MGGQASVIKCERAKQIAALIKNSFIIWPLLALSSFAQDKSGGETAKTNLYSPPPDQNLTEAFRRMRRNDSLQFDLPAAPPIPKTPGWLQKLGDAVRAIFDVLGPVFIALFWIGIGMLIAGALYLIAQTIYSSLQARKDRAKPNDPIQQAVPYTPQKAQALILLEEIDALAVNGQYDEAVHTLLRRSIQDIDKNRPNTIRRSLTSREIGSLPVLTGAAQSAFAAIAQITERSFFGGRKISRADYESARTAYANLVFGGSETAGMAA